MPLFDRQPTSPKRERPPAKRLFQYDETMWTKPALVAKAEQVAQGKILAATEATMSLAGELRTQRGLLAATQDKLLFVVDELMGPGDCLEFVPARLKGSTVRVESFSAAVVLDVEPKKTTFEGFHRDEFLQVLSASGLYKSVAPQKPLGAPLPVPAPAPVSQPDSPFGRIPELLPPPTIAADLWPKNFAEEFGLAPQIAEKRPAETDANHSNDIVDVVNRNDENYGNKKNNNDKLDDNDKRIDDDFNFIDNYSKKQNENDKSKDDDSILKDDNDKRQNKNENHIDKYFLNDRGNDNNHEDDENNSDDDNDLDDDDDDLDDENDDDEDEDDNNDHDNINKTIDKETDADQINQTAGDKAVLAALQADAEKTAPKENTETPASEKQKTPVVPIASSNEGLWGLFFLLVAGGFAGLFSILKDQVVLGLPIARLLPAGSDFVSACTVALVIVALGGLGTVVGGRMPVAWTLFAAVLVFSSSHLTPKSEDEFPWLLRNIPNHVDQVLVGKMLVWNARVLVPFAVLAGLLVLTLLSLWMRAFLIQTDAVPPMYRDQSSASSRGKKATWLLVFVMFVACAGCIGYQRTQHTVAVVLLCLVMTLPTAIILWRSQHLRPSGLWELGGSPAPLMLTGGLVFLTYFVFCREWNIVSALQNNLAKAHVFAPDTGLNVEQLGRVVGQFDERLLAALGVAQFGIMVFSVMAHNAVCELDQNQKRSTVGWLGAIGLAWLLVASWTTDLNRLDRYQNSELLKWQKTNDAAEEKTPQKPDSPTLVE